MREKMMFPEPAHLERPTMTDLAKCHKYLRTAAALLALSVATAALGQAPSLPYVVELSLNPSASINGFGGPNGNLAADKSGDVFVPDAAGSQVYEFPANGGAPLVIFDATKAGYPQVSGVAVDYSNNLYVMTRYDGNVSATETDVFEFPYVNGAYPAAYAYTGVAPAHCTATSTAVCMYGQFIGITGNYYQPQAIAFDGAGNGYLITTYDNYSGGGKTIFQCNVQCSQDLTPATIYADKLPTQALSIAADYAGDIFYADGASVYEVAAGSTTPVVFDNTLAVSGSGAEGVGFDRAGNLYVNVNQGGSPYNDGDYEYPLVNGKLSAANKILLDTQYGYTGPTVDAHGNIWTATYSGVYEFPLFNGSFPATALGVSSSPLTFTVLFNQAGSIASVQAIQSGAPATDFAVSNNGCANNPQGVRGTCTFSVTFTPSAVGVRKGAIVLTDTNGYQVTTYVSGVGTGTGVTVDPGTPVAIGSTFTTPSGIAVDGAGNVYVADAGAKTVTQYPAGNGTPVPVCSGYTKPTGVAIDPLGNVFVADNGAGQVDECALVNGALPGNPTPAAAAVVKGLTGPTDLVFDSIGELYVSATGSNAVLQYPNLTRYATSATMSSLGSGLSGPTGIAVDLNGNLYVADTGNNRVVEVSATAQNTVGNGLSAPTGVTVEPSGSVIIADQGNGRLVRVPFEATGLTTADQIALSQPLVNPYAVRLSSAGNLYVTDNQLATVSELQRTASTLNFGIENLNTPSAPQSVVISSTGTANLTLGSPLYAAVPANSGFTLTSGTSFTACASGTLPTGYDCTLSSTFDPTTQGTQSYPVTFNITATNAALPTLTLTGKGVILQPVSVKLSVTSPTGTPMYGQTIVIQAAVANAGTGTATPTGKVVFSVDGQASKAYTLNSSGTYSDSLAGLSGGSHTIQVTYNGDGNYASGSSSVLNLTISQATETEVESVTTDAAGPYSSAPGDPVTIGFTITPSVPGVFTGNVNFYNGSTLLGTSTVYQNTVMSGATQTYGASFTTSTLANGVYNVTAVFTGNSNYAGFTAPAVQIYVAPVSYTVTQSGNSLTSSASQPGSLTFTVTSFSDFQGGVDFTCSGLPANAYCIFRPGTATLVNAANTYPAQVPIQTVQLQVLVDESPVDVKSAGLFSLLGLLWGAGLLVCCRKTRGLRRVSLALLMAMLGSAGLGSLSGCGNGASSAYPTPAGSYPIVITATATPQPGGTEPSQYAISSFSSSATTGTITLTTTNLTTITAGSTVTLVNATPTAFNGVYQVATALECDATYPPPLCSGIPGKPTVSSTTVANTFTLPSTLGNLTGTTGSLRSGNSTNYSQTNNFTLVVQ
jgi:sugar lactone lactonase YvrE